MSPTRPLLQSKKTQKKGGKLQKKYDHINSKILLGKCVEKLLTKTEKKCLEAKRITPDKRKYQQKSLINFANSPKYKTPPSTPPRDTTPTKTTEARRSPRNKSPQSKISSKSPEPSINAASVHSFLNQCKTPPRDTTPTKTTEARTSPRNKSPQSKISSKSPEPCINSGSAHSLLNQCKTPPRDTTPTKTTEARRSPRNKSPKGKISCNSPEPNINTTSEHSFLTKCKTSPTNTTEDRRSPRNKSPKSKISSPEIIIDVASVKSFLNKYKIPRRDTRPTKTIKGRRSPGNKSPKSKVLSKSGIINAVSAPRDTTPTRAVANNRKTAPRNISREFNTVSGISSSRRNIISAESTKDSQPVLAKNKRKLNESKLATKIKQSPNKRKTNKKNGVGDNKSSMLNKWLCKTNDNIKDSDSSVKINNGRKNNRKLIRRQSSGTFEKYGINLPSYEDIISYQKKFENQKKIIEGLDLDDSQESLELNIEEIVPDNLLHCRHLSPREIEKAFTDNIQYICDIADGKRYSERHETFTRPNHAQSTSNLKYNTSMSVFTIEQKQLLLKRLRKLFENNENFCSNNHYYLQVLLPELCLKMFMDTHNMGHDEAVAYLEDRPVDEAL